MLCPRDRTPLTTVVRQTPRDRVEIDVCDRCHGAWFDRHELAAALGIGNLEAFAPESPLLEGDEASRPCPRNPGVRMHKRHLTLQDASLPKLEIDQCAECGGIWLDKGESQTIMKIGEKLQPVLDAEKAKAQEELAKMGDVDFSSPGLIARFLGLFKKKR